MAAVTPAPRASTNIDAILSDLGTGSDLPVRVCAAVVESTQGYDPALVPHSRFICPQQFNLVTTSQLTGCCDGLATEISGTIACCPCGAWCTGNAAPSMVEWSDGPNGPMFDWTPSTTIASRTDGAFVLPTDGSFALPTSGSALPTSTSGIGTMSRVDYGLLTFHFMLFALLWR
ncbi:hypothetical protein BKA66DRAFT_611844 [Pyrenochaeta sp. MPI-SDFR-AT-0127]|nr:hypothetical protein BKA66DRAFT_611844 [Pyrenochaeta sp. MPI-SDFR-AT-0127]